MILPSVHDVAAYILEKLGPVTAMKLQKLVYYCQAWSITWDDKPIYNEKIKAWPNGPIILELYDVHRGVFEVSEWVDGDANALGPNARETIDAVLEYYGDKSAQWLSDLAHAEAPWREARVGLPDRERGDKEITLASMHEYYLSLEPIQGRPDA